MTGVMLVKQRVASIDRWNAVFRDPELDGIRRRHGLVVTGTYVDGNDPNTVIVVMDMEKSKWCRAIRNLSGIWLRHANERARSDSQTVCGSERNKSTADHSPAKCSLTVSTVSP